VIFVTVGTQLAFDRLVSAVDRWAGAAGRTDVFAQIGPSELSPAHVRASRFVEPDEFARVASEARAIVAHAGMGSILTALQLGRPIVIMPRLARLKEHRNDHQLATCARFRGTPGVYVADNEDALAGHLGRIDTLVGGPRIPPFASEELVSYLRTQILGVDAASPAALRRPPA
jgi:UDP-N-acetylglucosamine transferase subunit ALG13